MKRAVLYTSVLPHEYLSDDTDFDFVLANDLPPMWSIQNTGRFVMMDNGLFERGEPFDAPRLSNEVNKVFPHVVIAPDYTGDPTRTKREVEEFLRIVDDAQCVGLVPVGSSREELIKCYIYFRNLLVERGHGVMCPSFLSDREALMEYLFAYGEVYSGWHHFLGFSTFRELASCINHTHGPVSFDTCKPFSAAYAHNSTVRQGRGVLQRAPIDLKFDPLTLALFKRLTINFREALNTFILHVPD